MRIYTFYIHELIEVIIVNKDKNLVFAPLQVVAPSFPSLDNSPKLLIMGLIMSFDKDYFLRKKYYKVPLTNFGLGEN